MAASLGRRGGVKVMSEGEGEGTRRWCLVMMAMMVMTVVAPMRW